MVTPLENRPWWSELVARLKSRKLRDLAREHGVSVAELQQALERTGHMPRTAGDAPAPAPIVPAAARPAAPKARAEAEGGASARLDAIRDLLGKIPDGEAASRVGVARKTVVEYRKRNNIERYRGADAREAEPVAKPAPAPVEVGPRSTGRASKLDAWLHLVGQKPDREVAELSGMTTENVRMYRLRRGIPAGWRGEGGAEPTRPARVEAAPAPVADAGRTPSRVDLALAPFLDQIGTVPDAEIAAKANISRSAVSAYRQRNNIAASVRAARPAPAADAPAAPAPAAAIVRELPAVVSVSASVYRVEANRGGEERAFGLQATDIVEAARLAHDRLVGAGWSVLSIRLVGDALP